MHVYTLRSEMLVKCSIEETFRFFNDPHNLAEITPSSLGFEVVSKEKVQMRKGAEIEYRIKWLAFPMHWKTLITEYEPPLLFVDEQAKGPYSYWRHEHTFVSTEDGTVVRDHLKYALPLGIFGRIAHAVVVRRQLRGIFNYRQQALSKIFEGKTVELQAPVIG